jgi:dipeptidyl aminopeptidase/acylaminoacyl peptidase
VDRLTNDDVWYGDPQWSPDGRTVVVHANKTPERESVRFSINKNFDLWLIDLATGKQQQLTTGPGPEISPRVSPDGKSIACLSIPRKVTHCYVWNLAILSLGDGARTLTILRSSRPPPTSRRIRARRSRSQAIADDADHLVCTFDNGLKRRLLASISARAAEKHCLRTESRRIPI